MSVSKRYPFVQKLLGLLIPKSLLAKRAAHQQLVVETVAKRQEQKTDRADFVSHMLKHKSDGNGLSGSEIISNTHVLIIGGSETTATLMSGATYHLLRNPATLKRLVDEVRETFETEDEISIQRTGDLKYMAAVLDEALRVYPPISTGLPRLVGPEGHMISGKFIPAGVGATSSCTTNGSMLTKTCRQPYRLVNGR
jgi:cytochrome P450